jgi:hypothetical protein
MKIITNATPTKELEAAIAAELNNKDKPETAIGELIRKIEEDIDDIKPNDGP